MMKDYYTLTKPGIIYGNAVTVIGGFLLASKGNPNLWLLLATLLGISLVIASSCVFNNYIDCDIDAKMKRTKDRALVRGTISARSALVYGGMLGISGFLTLVLYTNLLTTAIGLLGFVVYVVFYSIWGKRRSIYATHIGSIAGAVPPVVGYCAVTNTLDMGAYLLFLILIFWQMPHFFAIAMYRSEDYVAADIPVLPLKKGIRATKIHMLRYVFAFIVATHLLTVYGYTGHVYALVIGSLGFAWLALAVGGFWAKDDKRWARHMFFFSLIVIVLFSVMISFDTVYDYGSFPDVLFP